MSKKIAVFLSLLALITVIGAGCATEQGTEPTEQKADNSTPLTTNTENTIPDTNNNIALTVEKAGAGEVKLSWQTDMKSKTGWRVMNASRPLSEKPFWQLVNGEAKEFTLSGLSAGKRYFSVCAWTGTECFASSKEMELDIE